MVSGSRACLTFILSDHRTGHHGTLTEPCCDPTLGRPLKIESGFRTPVEGTHASRTRRA